MTRNNENNVEDACGKEPCGFSMMMADLKDLATARRRQAEKCEDVPCGCSKRFMNLEQHYKCNVLKRSENEGTDSAIKTFKANDDTNSASLQYQRTILDELQKMPLKSSITSLDEAAIPSFARVCNFLQKLVSDYAEASNKTAYRTEIRTISKVIAPSPALRFFLFSTTVPGLSIVKQLMEEMGTEKSEHVTSTGIVALKTALLSHPNANDYLTPGHLVSFLNKGCAYHAAGSDPVLQFVLDATENKYRNVQGGHLFGRMKIANEDAEGGECINGLRGMDLDLNMDTLPSLQCPDPYYALKVARAIAVICKCKDCAIYVDEMMVQEAI